jgi:hypothetical protein
MNTNRRHVRHNLALVITAMMAITAMVLLTAGSISQARDLPAAPADSITLPAVQDTYTDLNFPSTNFNGGLLTVANSPGAPGQPDIATKLTYVEFDLSSVTFEIKGATLSLATLTCGRLLPVDEVDVAVYGVDNNPANDWAEDTLTWDTQPPTPGSLLVGSPLIQLDAGTITGDTSARYEWTDPGLGALSAWLESQRTANDGSATLVLAIDNSEQPGIADVFFEDSEETGSAHPCPDSAGPPALEVVSYVTKFVYLPVVIRSG